MAKKKPSSDLIPTSEVAVILGVIPRRVQALVAEGRLAPAMTVGRAFLFRRADVEGFERMKRGPKPSRRK